MKVDPKVLATNLQVRLKQELPEPKYIVAVGVLNGGTKIKVAVKNCDKNFFFSKTFGVAEFDFDSIVSEVKNAIWSP